MMKSEIEKIQAMKHDGLVSSFRYINRNVNKESHALAKVGFNVNETNVWACKAGVVFPVEGKYKELYKKFYMLNVNKAVEARGRIYSCPVGGKDCTTMSLQHSSTVQWCRE
ncbi:hypothetical protein Cni_G10204 [Canna indica]|uniref:Uncharacterized protein n=1 Tax=Canna indica TaxID=4628 RepID=A0AAQ3K3U5_9LILI|nr:hypothetical protein Cni_G10204 [Canna indica]